MFDEHNVDIQNNAECKINLLAKIDEAGALIKLPNDSPF